jgi:hypothetical protein
MYSFSITRACEVLTLGLPIWLIALCLGQIHWLTWLRFTYVLFSSAVFVFFVLFWQDESHLGANNRWQCEPWKTLIMFAVMMVGMVASVYNAAIDERRLKRATLVAAGKDNKIPLQIDRWDIVQPMFYSLITFSALNAQVGANEFTTATVALSFQTGFLWHSVIDGKLKSSIGKRQSRKKNAGAKSG